MFQASQVFSKAEMLADEPKFIRETHETFSIGKPFLFEWPMPSKIMTWLINGWVYTYVGIKSFCAILKWSLPKIIVWSLSLGVPNDWTKRWMTNGENEPSERRRSSTQSRSSSDRSKRRMRQKARRRHFRRECHK